MINMDYSRKMHRCTVCKKSYINKPELEAHEWTHKGFAKRMQGPYKCLNSVCPFSEEAGGKRGFKCRRQLQTHIHKCQFANGQLQREEENVVDTGVSSSFMESDKTSLSSSPYVYENISPHDSSDTSCHSTYDVSHTSSDSDNVLSEDSTSISCASSAVAPIKDFVNPYPVVSAESVMSGPLEYRASRLWKASWKAKWSISRDAFDELEDAVINGAVQFTSNTHVSGRTLDRSLDNIYKIGVVMFLMR